MSKAIQPHREAAGEGQSTLAIPSSQTPKLKLALISLSIANLCFLLTWKQVLSLAEDPFVRYFEEAAPHLGLLLALIADVCILGLVVLAFGLLRSLPNRAASRAGSVGLGIFCFLAFYQLERLITQSLTEWNADFRWKALKIAAACVVLFLLVRYPRSMVRAAVVFLQIAFPIFLILALNGLWSYATVDLHHAGKGSAAAPMFRGTQQRPHLIWITFDELDDWMAFEARPQRIHLPEFDRLRSESVYGKARSPSTDTLWAMPSFLLGRKVLQVKPSTNRLQVQFGGSGEWMDAASLPNVFRSARGAGLNTGLTGWHHAYCRIFGNDLNDCSWMSYGPPEVRVEKLLRNRSFLRNAVYLLEWQGRWSVPALVEPWHLLPPEPEEVRMWREQQISAMQFIEGNGLRMLKNPDLNLVFIHIPTPHPPGIWDTKTGKFTLGDSNYPDNLALADATLGQIRKVMEQEGDWDSSAVLVSGDHPYRTVMWRASPVWTPEMLRLTGDRQRLYVPFLLKLSAQHSEVNYTREFNNVLSANLVFEILKGQLNTPHEVVNWLNTHAASSLR